MSQKNGRGKSAEAILSDLLDDQEVISDELTERLLSLIEKYEADLADSHPSQSDDKDRQIDELAGMVTPYLAEGLVLIQMDTAQILYGNPRLYEMYGWEPGELVGLPVSILNSERGQKPGEIANQVIAGVKVDGRWQGEILGRRKDGSEFWVLVSAGILDHPTFGQVQVSTQLDIDEQKQSELRYQALFHNRHDAILLHDLDGGIIAANQIAADMLGYTIDELIAIDPAELIAADEVPDREGRLKRLRAGEKFPIYERTARHKSGREFTVETSVSLITDAHGRPQHIQAIIREISERKRSEARLHALFEHTHDMVLFYELDGTIVAANDQALTVTGYSHDELIGMKIKDLVDPSEHHHLKPLLDQLLKEDRISLFERVSRKKGGEIYIAEVSMALVPGQGSSPPYIQAIARDITERKRHEARYRALFEHTQDAVVFYDLEGVVIQANAHAANMTGYALEDLVGLNARDLIAESDHSAMRETLGRVVQGETVERFEHTGVHKDGSKYQIEVLTTLISDEQGQPEYIQSVARDITQRKRNEARYRALFEKVQDSVILYDTDGIIIMANEQAGAMIGYPVDELIGLQIRDLIAEREIPSMQGLRERLLAGETLGIFERVATRADGSEYQVEIDMSLVQIEEGKPPYIQSIVRDITERKQSEARYEALFNRNNDAIVLIDLDGRITAANPSAVEMTGYSLEELPGMYAWDLVAESQVAASRSRLAEIAQNTDVPIYERLARRKNGEEYIVEVSASLVTDAEGRPLHIQSMYRDITERKESEERYRALFENTHDGVFIIGLDKRVMLANPQASAILGYTHEELIGRFLPDLIPQHNLDASTSRHNDLVAGKEVPPIYERMAVHKDGRELILEINASLVRDMSGDPHHIQAVFRDISDRKRDAERYRALFEHSHDAILIFGMDGRIISANARFSEMTGYSLDELIGRDGSQLLGSAEGADGKARMARVLEGEPMPLYERIGRRKNGEEFACEVSLTLVRDLGGQLMHFQAAIRDITERKASELRYRALFENTHDAVMIIDLDGYNIQVNAQAAEMLGYSVDELIGKHFEELVVDREVQDASLRRQRLIDGESVPIYERIARRKDGSEIAIEVSASLVRDASGEPLHIQSVFRDITERRESQAQYRALFENMHDAVLIIGLDGQTLMANPQAEAMLGYTLEELLKSRTGSLLTEQEARDAIRRHERLIAGEVLPPYERVIRHKDGHELTIEINMSLIRDAYGEPRHIQSVFRDITERKRIAMRYEALLESNQDSVVIFGLDGTIIEVNEQAAQMSGYSREELIGMSARTFVSPIEFEHLGEVQMRLLAGEILPRYQRIGVRKDGSEYIMEINMTVVWDERGNPSHWQSISRDITERIRGEEETSVQSQITAHLTEGLMLVRASDDVIVYTNPAMRKMFGYSEGEMVGNYVWMLNADEGEQSRTVTREINEQVARTGSWQGEIRNKKKSGEFFWTYASTTTIDHYEHGLVYLSTQVDITDRKRLEQELILQGAIARNLSESVNLVRASDQVIVYTNDRFDELFGCEPGEMIGRKVTELNPQPPGEGEASISELYIQQVAADGHWQGEILNVRKDGSQFWTLASIALIEHPEHGKVYIATRVDITDRVEATNRLETAIARLDHLIRSVNVVVYTFALTEGYPTTYISDSTERIMGYPASRFLEDPTFYRENVHPEDMPRVAEAEFDPDALEQVLEYRYQRSDGEWIWLQDHIRMLTDEDGNVVEGLGVKLDITDMRKAQENLNRAVRLAAGGEVAAGVAHQINNPLTIILAQASLIKGDLPPDSKLHSSLDIILRAIERAGKVVQRLLYMSKVLPYDFEHVDLNHSIESTAGLIMAQFEADRSSITMDLDPDIPPIWASESHLGDVWLNLLINARDAAKPGESIHVHIQSRLINKGKDVEIRIRDDGLGIDPKQLDSIFLPLYTTKAQHTGLGLPFCMEVITRHGGIMEVESVLGQGATFVITLPMQEREEEA